MSDVSDLQVETYELAVTIHCLRGLLDRCFGDKVACRTVSEAIDLAERELDRRSGELYKEIQTRFGGAK